MSEGDAQTSSSESGSGGIDAGAAIGGFLGGFLGTIGAGGFHGTGRAASRGFALAGLKMQQLAAKRAIAEANYARAQGRVPASQHPVTIQTNRTQQVVHIASQLVAVASKVLPPLLATNAAKRAIKKKAHEEAVLRHKLARAIAKAPPAQFMQIATTGLNYGPPIPGQTFFGPVT